MTLSLNVFAGIRYVQEHREGENISISHDVVNRIVTTIISESQRCLSLLVSTSRRIFSRSIEGIELPRT